MRKRPRITCKTSIKPIEARKTKSVQDAAAAFYGISSADIAEEKQRLLQSFEKCLNDFVERLEGSDVTTVFVEYGGFGDAIHSRLMIQQYISKHLSEKVVWFVNEKVAAIYKDDLVCRVFGHDVVNRYRYPHVPGIFDFIKKMNALVAVRLQGYRTFDISYNLIRYHVESRKRNEWTSFEWPFFDFVGMKRNRTVKHKAKHIGTILGFSFAKQLNGRPWVLLETSSMSFASLSNHKAYEKLVKCLLADEIPVVLVGSKSDPLIEGCIDARGIDFYDVDTLMRACTCFVGRNSANQMLSVFRTKPIRIFELDTSNSPLLAFESCKYLPAGSTVERYDTRKTDKYIESIIKYVNNSNV